MTTTKSSFESAVEWLKQYGHEFIVYPERERLLVMFESKDSPFLERFRLPLDGFEQDDEIVALVVFPR